MDGGYYLGLLFVYVDIFVLVYGVTEEYSTEACYGTHQNFLELKCDWGDKIKIHKVYQGAKPTTLECPYPMDQNSYKKDCCVSSKDDCMFAITSPKPNSYESQCNGKSTCSSLTMWTATTGRCDPTKYNSVTNFMKITYSCIPGKKRTTIQSTTQRVSTKRRPGPKAMTDTTSPEVTKNTQKNAAKTATESSTTPTIPYYDPSNRTQKPKTRATKSDNDDEYGFTTGMMGAMVAAIIGLMLTIFGFIFYWGSKRRHHVMTKPQTSVWDFLLSQSITFRPFRRGGYDNFNSHRSSISSDGETSSPVTRKSQQSGWTPNIAVETISVEPTTSDDNCSIVDVHRHV